MNETLMEVEHTPPVHKRILDIMPGVSGGVARIMVGQPFDTIKTRLQVLGKGTIGAAGMPPEMVYTSGMDCVKKMVSALCLCLLPAWQECRHTWQTCCPCCQPGRLRRNLGSPVLNSACYCVPLGTCPSTEPCIKPTSPSREMHMLPNACHPAHCIQEQY
jgi:hypothetical protein